MAEVIDSFLTFVREYPLIVVGIMGLGGLYFLLDRELTILCPVDERAMKRIEKATWQCPKCGFVKRV